MLSFCGQFVRSLKKLVAPNTTVVRPVNHASTRLRNAHVSKPHRRERGQAKRLYNTRTVQCDRTTLRNGRLAGCHSIHSARSFASLRTIDYDQLDHASVWLPSPIQYKHTNHGAVEFDTPSYGLIAYNVGPFTNICHSQTCLHRFSELDCVHPAILSCILGSWDAKHSSYFVSLALLSGCVRLPII